MLTPTSVVAYLALFAGLAFLFLFINLWVGSKLRNQDPHPEKLEVYECGEPTIGSSFVQFDLRFYVVALLFIIFDVEVAFFFPWATVFGKATHLMDPRLPVVAAAPATPGPTGTTADPTATSSAATVELTPHAASIYRELGIANPAVPTLSTAQYDALTVKLNRQPTPVEAADAAVRGSARRLAGLSIVDIAVFFAVLMVGFAYVWRRGDLDWVRAVAPHRATPAPPPAERQPILVA